MLTIGLKLWSTNCGSYLREAARLYETGLYDYVELYVVPDTEDHLSHWQGLRRELNLPFVIHNAHYAHGFNLADRLRAASNRRIYDQTRRYADALEARHVIFHGGVDGLVAETVRQLVSFHEPRALLENKPFLPMLSATGVHGCRGATADEIAFILDEAGCGFCLDIGHAVCAANALGLEPYAFVEKLSGFGAQMFHLSDVRDMTSPYDAHPHLGTGRLDIPRIARTLFAAGAVVSVETEKSSADTLEDFADDVRYLRKVWRSDERP